jgi:hypothetical protein
LWSADQIALSLKTNDTGGVVESKLVDGHQTVGDDDPSGRKRIFVQDDQDKILRYVDHIMEVGRKKGSSENWGNSRARRLERGRKVSRQEDEREGYAVN